MGTKYPYIIYTIDMFHFPKTVSYITLALIVIVFEMQWKKGIEICTYRRHIYIQFITNHNEGLKIVTVGQSQTRAEKIAVNFVHSTPLRNNVEETGREKK